MNSLICSAIQEMKLIEFYYENEIRIVEPHCHGLTTAGNKGLRAYQVEGYSSSGNMGWKMYDLSKAHGIKKLNRSFYSPRPGYKRNDSGMSVIYCQI